MNKRIACVFLLTSLALCAEDRGVKGGNEGRLFSDQETFETFSHITFEERQAPDSESFAAIPRENNEIADAASDLKGVDVKGGKLAKKPVTNKEYQKFLIETGRAPPPHWKSGKLDKAQEEKPVVNISYDDAQAYAKWASKRLPTHTEWMNAQVQLPLDFSMPVNEWTSSPAGSDMEGPKQIIFNRQNSALSTMPSIERNLDTGFRVVSPDFNEGVQAPEFTTPGGNVILPDQNIETPSGDIMEPEGGPYNPNG